MSRARCFAYRNGANQRAVTTTLSPGVLVAFEGIDGGGKSTQAAKLAAWGAARGYEVVSTREPTQGPLGQKIRASRFSGRLSPEEELRCFIEDRREHVAQELAPALARGALVIIDRYYYSNAAYQGALGMDPLAIIAANEAFAPKPDVVFLLDLGPTAGLERVQRRGEGQDLFETAEALTRCRALFLSLPGPVVRLDAGQAPEAVHALVVDHMTPLVSARER